MTDWRRPQGGIGYLLTLSLVFYGALCGLAVGALLDLVSNSWWLPVVGTAIFGAPTVWLVARYGEDRKDRRELIGPINEICASLIYFRLGLDRFSSMIRLIRDSTPPAERRDKVDFLMKLVDDLQNDLTKIKPDARIPPALSAVISQVVERAMEDCREAFRRVRGASFLSNEEQGPDMDEAVRLSAGAPTQVSELVDELHSRI